VNNRFDVIVIGAGHAGCEAALAAARMGSKTILLTMNNDRIGYMSCNPAIGGQAKGQLAREVDALGGQMGINTDMSALQYKRLNSSKGPAVRSSRAQCDKVMYSLNMKNTVENQPNLTVAQQEVRQILTKSNQVFGVETNFGEHIFASSVVITAGTFMRSIMHCGDSQSEGGRAGDSSASAISNSLKALGFDLVRLKTGTPARLQKKSIRFDQLQREDGDKNPLPFSFYSRPDPFPFLQQLPCYLTYTNVRTHEVIAAAKDRSPLFTGSITGRGPRYCPSIEDKVFRFVDKDRHQIFLEPESQFSNEIYANGLSTSLPLDIQQEFLRTIDGLENVEIARPGYAVEYDAIRATVLRHSLEAKDIGGLFFAGQVNGTSGYEEAAAQGLVAGVNASLKVTDREPFVLRRDQAYIGVLIDDLVTKGCDEPYRMFTSRAEFRLSLREDNADQRLAEIGFNLGILSKEKWGIFCKKLNDINILRASVRSRFFYGRDFAENSNDFKSLGVLEIKDRIALEDLVRRPEINFAVLAEKPFFYNRLEMVAGFESAEWLWPHIEDAVEVETKYFGYIRREQEQISRMIRQEELSIPDDFSYASVSGLSTEVQERLSQVRPVKLGQVFRMSGITPTAAALIMVHLEKRKRGSSSRATV
jgi:tRNA uridine 5-carboxymethylaminomethyl modification enzyme